jgi:hypothetical protein
MATCASGNPEYLHDHRPHLRSLRNPPSPRSGPLPLAQFQPMVAMTIVLYSSDLTSAFYPDVAEVWSCDRDPFSQGYPVQSGLFICPECCHLWAKLTLAKETNFYEARSIPCHRHPSYSHPDLRPVPGSILDNPSCNGIDLPLLMSMPEDLLRREFDLHLKAYQHWSTCE